MVKPQSSVPTAGLVVLAIVVVALARPHTPASSNEASLPIGGAAVLAVGFFGLIMRCLAKS